ncbi:MAG TPA: hypothetical protein VFC99_01645 [Acidimicrobiia bacterium]|nr:hypothetical protein [Acidimicrobiia bacterium]
MSADVEPVGGAAAAGELIVPTFEESVEEQLLAERSLWRSVVIGTIIAVPICIAIWLAIVVIAIGGNSGVSWGVWLGIGAVIGLVAGGFFGGLFAFVTQSHVLDAADRHAAAAKHAHASGH